MQPYTPHLHIQSQSIAPQLSHPMALRKIRFEADQPRHKSVLMKNLALKEALKSEKGQHH